MIVIVGGGITGLSLGWELSALGEEYVVLEADSRPGGVIRSAEIDGRLLDWGPQRTRLSGPVSRIINALGLAEEVVTARPALDLFVYREGRLRTVPFSAAAFLTSDTVSWSAKVRALAEPFTSGADPEESVASYFTRKFGTEVYETLIAPLYGGLYASDPADMRVGLSLNRVLESFGVGRSVLIPLLRRGGQIRPPPACTFRQGMQTLPLALATSLGERLRLNTEVTAIRRTRSGWAVDSDGGTFEADDVVLTAPAMVCGRLLAHAAPEAAKAMASLRYNPLAVVHLDAETALEGLGFQVAFTERQLTLRGVTFNDSLFARRNLYTAYLGGARHAEVADMSDEELGNLATREFEQCTGCPATVLSVRHERMPAWDVSWAAISGIKLPRGLHLAANWWSRPGLPGRLTEASQMATRLTRASDSGRTA